MREQIGWIQTRRIAWLLIVVYAWLSSVLQLTHTDDLRTLAPIHSTADVVASLHVAGPPVGPDHCLAHEWSGAVHTAGQPIAPAVLLAHFLPNQLSPAPVVPVHPGCFDDRPFRSERSELVFREGL